MIAPPQQGHLVVFMRWPEAGKTKTRLIPALGAEGAAALHRQMAEQTLAIARAFCGEHDVLLTVCFTGTTPDVMQSWLGQDIAFEMQVAGDLGARLRHTSEQHCAAGAYVLIIGTDCPELTPAVLERAAAAMVSHDVVLGPAQDGGYYLIGVKQACAALFEGMAWGESTVCRATEAAAAAEGLSLKRLSILSDVVRPEDLVVASDCV